MGWIAVLGELKNARALVWVSLIAFATGLPLMVDSPGIAPSITGALQGLHAASALLLVVGSLVHAAAKWLPGAGSRRARSSGAWALAALGIASISGALTVRSVGADQLMATMGIGGVADDAKTAAAVIHIVYAVTLVMLTLYWHLGRLGVRRAMGSWPQAALAVGACLGTALIAGGGLGVDSSRPATAIVAPPMAGLWAWTLIVAVAFLLASRWVRAPRQEPTSREADP